MTLNEQNLNMMNRFLLRGTLSEHSVSGRTNISVKLAVDVNGVTITCRHSVSSTNAEKLHAWQELEPNLVDVMSGKTPSRLVISGNLYQWNDNIMFYSEHISLTDNPTDDMSIEMIAIPMGGAAYMNALYDSPRCFDILNAPKEPSNTPLYMRLVYGAGWRLKHGVIVNQPKHGLACLSCRPVDCRISADKVARLKKEWEIISDAN